MAKNSGLKFLNYSYICTYVAACTLQMPVYIIVVYRDDGPDESEYTFSGAAETYKDKDPAAAAADADDDHDSDLSCPDSPHRLLTQGPSGDPKTKGIDKLYSYSDSGA